MRRFMALQVTIMNRPTAPPTPGAAHVLVTTPRMTDRASKAIPQKSVCSCAFWLLCSRKPFLSTSSLTVSLHAFMAL